MFYIYNKLYKIVFVNKRNEPVPLAENRVVKVTRSPVLIDDNLGFKLNLHS